MKRVELSAVVCAWPLSVTSGEEPSHFPSQANLIFTSFPCSVPLPLREAVCSGSFGISSPWAAEGAAGAAALRQQQGCTDANWKSQTFLVNEGLVHLYPFPSPFLLTVPKMCFVSCVGFFLSSHQTPLFSLFFCHLTLCPDLKIWLSGTGGYFSPINAASQPYINKKEQAPNTPKAFLPHKPHYKNPPGPNSSFAHYSGAGFLVPLPQDQRCTGILKSSAQPDREWTWCPGSHVSAQKGQLVFETNPHRKGMKWNHLPHTHLLEKVYLYYIK